jgi:cell division protein ZapA (FtsZ GTPase activity inhibitor)
MADNERITVEVGILDKEHKITCNAEDKDVLLKTAGELKKLTNSFRDKYNIQDKEKCLVMSSLLILKRNYELLNASLSAKESLERMNRLFDEIKEDKKN